MNTTVVKNYSEYLSFRSFYTGFPVEENELPQVKDAGEMVDVIERTISSAAKPAILLSGGMDSAVLAPFMPRGTNAYTIFHGRLKENELELAESYCRRFSLNHIPLEIQSEEYLDVMDELTLRKRMPLSPAEPIFYLAARRVRQDGHGSVVTGAGADAKLGGFRSLRPNISAPRYEQRLQKRYLAPGDILRLSTSIDHVLNDFVYTNRKGDVVVNSRSFLRAVSVERFAYNNAIGHAGCEHVAPYSQVFVRFNHQKNQERPKYLVSDLYERIYGHAPPPKLGLQKPTYLLSDYRPTARIFRRDLDLSPLSYPKKFLIYSLERYHLLNYGDVGFRSLRLMRLGSHGTHSS